MCRVEAVVSHAVKEIHAIATPVAFLFAAQTPKLAVVTWAVAII